ncbi:MULTISPECIES: PEP-CTERM sorting domain-containing protein [unclassified Lentimonas]|uniref:PEP-CTERM sorting domain-containing protein n=1 Tax=unclassified Lentimonas TaxID=2630993 RepID=UPI001328840B|nr:MULTISPECIES: PEP-CTERM sorting domain-containing protein [unclassified Lentimonas]CAA6693099.1 Unannotated [Lentimonas sp. CC19]CAA6695656.1 Unannotated [Lentimonas sp. CC10]CAA7071517.1 Unannotated [Lentimonas sp. CC11]
MNHTQKFLAAAAITFIGVSAASAQTIVAGWDGGGSTPTVVDATKVTAALGTQGVSSFNWSGRSSTDGTWGSVSGPATVNNANAWQVKGDLNQSQLFTITNTSGADLIFDSIHFDYAHIFGAITVNVTYVNGGLGLTDGTSLGSVSTNGSSPSLSDWDDADFTIGSAAFATLANNQSATFRFDITGAGTGGMDNIAISIVPEPSSYALISGCFLMGFVALRRRSRS